MMITTMKTGRTIPSPLLLSTTISPVAVVLCVAICISSLRSCCWSLAPPLPLLVHTGIHRREVLASAGACTAALIGGVTLPSSAASIRAPEDGRRLPSLLTVPKHKSVLVLGGNGGTGREAVKAVLASGRRCLATSRSGVLNYEVTVPTTSSSSLSLSENPLTVLTADVTDVTSVQHVISSVPPQDIGAVIFAASASTKNGGNNNNAYQVDRDGVIRCAQCCIDNNINRFCVVSSGTVTRPDSAVYQLLNTVGKGIMEAKIQGEDQVRAMYSQPDVVNKKLGYTIIRPGGLTSDDAVPSSMVLELNQGDTKSGRISRVNVAALCVQCLDSSETFDTTFECYETVTAKPIESVGLSNLLKQKNGTVFQSGKERHGETWNTLFEGLERDIGHNV